MTLQAHLLPGDKIAIRTGDTSWRVIQPEGPDTEIYGELPADAERLVTEVTQVSSAERQAYEVWLARVTQERDEARAEVSQWKADVGNQMDEAAELRQQLNKTRVAAGIEYGRYEDRLMEVRTELDRVLGQRDNFVADLEQLRAELANAETELARVTGELELAEVTCPACGATIRARMADAPPTAPGHHAIADAVEAACEVAALDLELYQRTENGTDGDGISEPYRRIARILDAAGLIDWNAVADPTPPVSRCDSDDINECSCHGTQEEDR